MKGKVASKYEIFNLHTESTQHSQYLEIEKMIIVRYMVGEM